MPEYLEATIVEEGCSPVAQITGTSIGEAWKGYENCVVIHNPESDRLPSSFLKKDSTFYFLSYELSAPPVCPDPSFTPGIVIRVKDFSAERP
ncbi:MAG: hypothetical protein LRY55_15460 [Leadbetterella sp.]|nr:hypothetical protein [Leadbetterella sp.]